MTASDRTCLASTARGSSFGSSLANGMFHGSGDGVDGRWQTGRIGPRSAEVLSRLRSSRHNRLVSGVGADRREVGVDGGAGELDPLVEGAAQEVEGLVPGSWAER